MTNILIYNDGLREDGGRGKGRDMGLWIKVKLLTIKFNLAKKKCRIQTNHSAKKLIDMFYHVTELHVFLCVSQKETDLSFRQISAKEMISCAGK